MSVSTIIEHLQQANNLQDTKAVTKFKKALVGIKQYRSMSQISLYRDINENNNHLLTRHYVIKMPAVRRMITMLSSYATFPKKWEKELLTSFIEEDEDGNKVDAFPMVDFGIEETGTHVKLWIGFPAPELPHIYSNRKLNKTGDALSRFMGGVKCFTYLYNKENKTVEKDDDSWLLMPHPNKAIWQDKMWKTMESRFSAETIKVLKNAYFFNIKIGKKIRDTEITVLATPIETFQSSLDFSIQSIQDYLKNEKITDLIDCFTFNESSLKKKKEKAIKFSHQFSLGNDKRPENVSI